MAVGFVIAVPTTTNAAPSSIALPGLLPRPDSPLGKHRYGAIAGQSLEEQKIGPVALRTVRRVATQRRPDRINAARDRIARVLDRSDIGKRRPACGVNCRHDVGQLFTTGPWPGRSIERNEPGARRKDRLCAPRHLA